MAELPLAVDPREPYTYKPLRNNGGGPSIRLFFLDCTNNIASEVSGFMAVAKLQDTADFTALSYAWGTTYEDGSHLTKSIICDGRRLQITETLEQALKRIRTMKVDGTKDRVYSPLWIDAICINQEDLVERSEQVALMAQIYSHNTNLLIWLGESSEPGFQPLQSNTQGPVLSSKIQKAFHQGANAVLPRAKRRDEISFLLSILSKPWFHRRWVIQETAHCKPDRTIIIVGGSTYKWSALTKALEAHGLLSSAPPFAKYFRRAGSALKTFFYYDDCECSDPRDRIYAIKDLTQRGHYVYVDYNRDVRETYLAFARTAVLGVREEEEFMRDFTRLDIDRMMPTARMSPRREDMYAMFIFATCKPSDESSDIPIEGWVPDWRTPTRYVSPAHAEAVSGFMRSTLSWGTPAYVNLDIQDNGYHLLSWEYQMVIAPYLIWTSSNDANISATAPADTWLPAMRWLTAYAKHVADQTPDYVQETDRLWIWQSVAGETSDYSPSPFILVLRPSTQAWGDARKDSVYRLHSCFSVPKSTELEHLADEFRRDQSVKTTPMSRIFSLVVPPPDLEEALSSSGIFVKQSFWLD